MPHLGGDADGQTPLDPDEAAQILRPAITTRGELDIVGDSRLWVENATYEPSELGVRFHHRLVAIHPYPNGNGRHSRLAADILSVSLGGAPFA